MTGGNGLFFLSGHVEEIKMEITVFFTAEYEMLSVFQENKVIEVILVYVVFILFPVQHCRIAYPAFASKISSLF